MPTGTPVTGFTIVSYPTFELGEFVLDLFFFFFKPEGGLEGPAKEGSSTSELEAALESLEDVPDLAEAVLGLFCDNKGAGNFVAPLGLNLNVSTFIPLLLRKANK